MEGNRRRNGEGRENLEGTKKLEREILRIRNRKIGVGKNGSFRNRRRRRRSW